MLLLPPDLTTVMSLMLVLVKLHACSWTRMLQLVFQQQNESQSTHHHYWHNFTGSLCAFRLISNVKSLIGRVPAWLSDLLQPLVSSRSLRPLISCCWLSPGQGWSTGEIKPLWLQLPNSGTSCLYMFGWPLHCLYLIPVSTTFLFLGFWFSMTVIFLVLRVFVFYCAVFFFRMSDCSTLWPTVVALSVLYKLNWISNWKAATLHI